VDQALGAPTKVDTAIKFLGGPKAYIDKKWDEFSDSFYKNWGMKKDTPPDQNTGGEK
jgi:hypothetical protein